LLLLRGRPEQSGDRKTPDQKKFASSAFHLILRRAWGLDVVARVGHAGFARAIGAAIEGFVRFDAVTDDSAATVPTNRGQFLNRAFEAIEGMLPACRNYVKGQVIIVSANFTLGHGFSLVEKRGPGTLHVLFPGAAITSTCGRNTPLDFRSTAY
jgi:hypothetical protein